MQVRLRAQALAEHARAAAAAEAMPCVALHVVRHPEESVLPQLARPFFVGPASLSILQLEQVLVPPECCSTYGLSGRCARGLYSPTVLPFLTVGCRDRWERNARLTPGQAACNARQGGHLCLRCTASTTGQCMA